MQERYKKLALLGKGATAQVFLVEEVGSGRRYAMKVFGDEKIFHREKENWKALTKEQNKEKRYFPELIEYLEEEKALVMEYLEGKDLQTILDSGQDLSMEEVVGIMEEVLNALQVLHGQALVYRDLKPANIMLCKDGRVRLIDLGAVCLTGAITVTGERRGMEALNATEKLPGFEEVVIKAGTYGYAAPEQFWDDVRPEKTCDIYSTGKVLAYLLTGKNPAQPPYDVEHYCKGMKRVPAEFLRVINRSLAKEPQARYADCESMKRAIRKAYDDCRHWKCFHRHGKSTITYEKCIWKSEYRRIF